MGILRKKQQKPLRRQASASHTRTPEGDLGERYAFRRNRTLTGSLSSNVQSANEHRAELKSARIHAHDLRKYRRRLSLIFFGIILATILLGWMVYQSIAIPKVVAASATTRPIEAKLYEEKIQHYLNDHFFERNRTTLNTTNLTSYLQQNGCPEVEAVTTPLQFAGLGASTIKLTMRQPAVGWETGTSQLYVDVEGNAFSRNYFAAPAVNIVDETGITPRDNQVLASNRFLGFIGRTVGRFKNYEYIVTKVSLPAATTHQIYVNLAEVPYPVKLLVDRPVGEQVEDAVRSMRYLTQKGITPEYLDVRVSGRAYYQ